MLFGLITFYIYAIKCHTSYSYVSSFSEQNFLKVSKSTSINLPDEPFISADRHVHVPSMCYLGATIRVLSSTSNKRPPIKRRGTLRSYIPWSFRGMKYEEINEIGLGPSATPTCYINATANRVWCCLRITMASDQFLSGRKKSGSEVKEREGKRWRIGHRGT